MSGQIIHDLDVLRPAPEYVQLAGKKIDISFIPSGVAIDVMKAQQELQDMTDTPEKMAALEGDVEGSRRTFEICAEICSLITKSQHPEMDSEWLLANTDVVQVRTLLDLVTTSVSRSIDQAEGAGSKKPKATETGP